MNTSDYQVQYRPFKYDATVYKDFSHAKRVVIEDSQPLMKLTLGNEDAELLKQGLGPFDMDDRWAGNLADSTANKDAKEAVVRLYRTWTGSLIYEARYRPAAAHEELLTLYEFAYESNKKLYQHGDTQDELSKYEVLLKSHILDLIKTRLPKKK